MYIASHPIWKNTTPYKTKISAYKKPFHIARIYMAKQYAKLFPRSMFIGITGSVGKTTTATAAAFVLSQKFSVVRTKSNLDTILNLPLTIFKINPKVKRVILELGIEYPGEMDFYLSLIKPATAIVTTISYQHTEYLNSLKES